MSEYIDLPGSGSIRITTSEDLERANFRPAVERRPMRTLTASASRLRASSSTDSVYLARMSQPWQSQALSYYDQIGEIRFASQFYAKLLSKISIYPALQKRDGKTEPITEGAPVEILHRLQDPGGGRSRLQYDYGQLMFITGEGVLFIDQDRHEIERARFLWKDEIKRTDDGMRWQRVRFDKQPYDPPEVGQAYRFWTPHPRHSDEADSPLRSVLNIANELLQLEAAVLSTAVSRMTNGMILIPQELSPNPPDPVGDEDPENNIFLSDYIEHTTAQKDNPGSAAAAMAFTLEGAYDYIDRVRWMATHDPQTDYMEKELRKEAVHRLALGMDFPPEFLLGMTDANHWTARQVVYDMWRSYGTPIAERFCDDISDSYLRPLLEEEGYEGWEEVVVTYDDSQVVISPDRTEDADKALDRIAIGFEGYRVMKAIPEEYAPSETEKEFLASLKLRQPIELEDGELVIPQRGPVAQANGNSPEDGPSVPSGGREGSRQEARTASLRIHGAAELALMRCRELAGVRIRHKCPDCGEGVPDTLVAATVGAEFEIDPMKMVRGATDGFQLWMVEQEGVEPAQASALGQQLEVLAARTLREPRCPALPSGFVSAIEKAKETSDALA